MADPGKIAERHRAQHLNKSKRFKSYRIKNKVDIHGNSTEKPQPKPQPKPQLKQPKSPFHSLPGGKGGGGNRNRNRSNITINIGKRGPDSKTAPQREPKKQQQIPGEAKEPGYGPNRGPFGPNNSRVRRGTPMDKALRKHFSKKKKPKQPKQDHSHL